MTKLYYVYAPELWIRIKILDSNLNLNLSRYFLKNSNRKKIELIFFKNFETIFLKNSNFEFESILLVGLDPNLNSNRYCISIHSSDMHYSHIF